MKNQLQYCVYEITKILMVLLHPIQQHLFFAHLILYAIPHRTAMMTTVIHM